jgi:hypothetical protein
LEIRDKIHRDLTEVIMAMGAPPAQVEHPIVCAGMRFAPTAISASAESSIQKQIPSLCPPSRPVVAAVSAASPTGMAHARAEKLATDLIRKWDAIPGNPASFHDVGAYDPLVHWGAIFKMDPSMLPLAIVAMSYLQCKAFATGNKRISESATLIETAVRSGFHSDMLKVLVFAIKNEGFLPEVEEVEAEYWRRRTLIAAEKKGKVTEATAAAAQEAASERADDSTAEQICDDDDHNDLIINVPSAFDGVGGEFSIEEMALFFGGIAKSRSKDVDGLTPCEGDFEAYLSELRVESFVNETDTTAAANDDYPECYPRTSEFNGMLGCDVVPSPSRV